MAESIKDNDPTAPLEDSSDPTSNLIFPWIQHDAKVIFCHPSLGPKPKWGYFQHDESQHPDEALFFIAGKNKTGNRVQIPILRFITQDLLTEHRLFRGWKTIKTVGIARRKISAETLEVQQVPATLLRHNRLTPQDRILWDAAYAEEYYGLQDLGTREVISNEEYQKLKPVVGNALPSMAISTIKEDQDGKPIGCKYHLVVLGNLEPSNWSKSDCFAPVLSQLELRLLLTIAVSKTCTPKTADVSQAFVQSVLTSNEPYVIKSQTGCPLSKPSTYLRLLKTNRRQSVNSTPSIYKSGIPIDSIP